MKKINLITVEDILDFAINNEENAVDFYRDLAEDIEDPEVRDTVEGFAEEEISHKEKLEMVKEGKMYLPKDEKEMGDLNLEIEVEEEDKRLAESDLKEIYKLAVQREKESFELYDRLAGSIDDKETEEILNALAREEVTHRMFFERQLEKDFN